MGKGDGSVLGKLAWKLRPTESLRMDALEVTDGRYIAVSSGSKQRLWAFVRVRLPDPQEDPRMDYASAMRISVQQQRIRGLFEGLYRSSIPFMYVSMMTQAQSSEEKELFEFDLAVGTWADGKLKRAEEVEQTLEQRASVLAATLTVALPSATVSRLLRGDLTGFAKGLYLPGEPTLQQTADPATVATLVSFDQQNPQVGKSAVTPGFYVPNVAESGRSGVLLGPVKSGSGTFHDLYLQLEDLKRHLVILGMTGSGKSTTGSTVVRQVIALGLPVLVLDWHNEYGRTILESGGRVVSPGKDEFTTNPLEAGDSSDPVEHLA
ncbi:MAG TPA: DUF87 domain-containing protein, partial [Nitrososphaerales archaeon]|nr:DUF87 domain-containing protein [Nitrososphaerales archaeon]